MRQREERARSRSGLAALVAMGLLIGLVAAGTTLAQEERIFAGDANQPRVIPNKALDCNADVQISHTPMVPATMFDVTLTVTAVDARDFLDACQPMEFNQVSYSPDCASTLPCVPNAVGPVTFVGPVGGTCGSVNSSVAAGAFDQVDFTFPAQPGGVLTLTPTGGGGPCTPDSCAITFKIQVPPTAVGYTSEVTSVGLCGDLGLGPPNDFTSTTTGNALIMGVPAMGAWALAILSLLLIGVSGFYLRQRPSIRGASV